MTKDNVSSTEGSSADEATPRARRPGFAAFFRVDPKPRPKSNFAQILSAAIAVVATLGIVYQVNLNRQSALRSSARQVYLAYSQATLQFPRLAQPNYPQLKAATDPTDLVRYKIYITHLLTAYDEILSITDEPEWVAAFEYDVVDHMPYLCEQNDPTFYAQFYVTTRDLVAGAKRKYCGSLADILKRAPVYPTKP